MIIGVLETLVIVAIHILSWIAVCHALLTKHDPRAALGWTVTALLLPLIGPLLYATFGISLAESRASRIMRRQEPLEPDYAHPPFSDNPPEKVPDYIISMEKVGRHLTEQHLSSGNKLMTLHNGDEAYPQMLAAIREAREQVFLCTYIFNAGKIAAEFGDALTEAAQRGVDVRLLVDGIGMLYSWRKPWKKLAEHGVHVAMFLPPRLFPPNFSINLRNHRKMLVCDNTAFTGGMNISDDNIASCSVVSPSTSYLNRGSNISTIISSCFQSTPMLP